MHDGCVYVDRFSKSASFGCGSILKKYLPNCYTLFRVKYTCWRCSAYAGDMDDSPSNRCHSEGPKNGSIVNFDSQEATGIMVVDRPDLEGADSREKRGREVGGFKIVAEGKEKGEEEEDDSVSSDSSEEDEEVDEHRLLSASFHAKAAAAVKGGAGGGGKSTGIAVAQSDHGTRA